MKILHKVFYISILFFISLFCTPGFSSDNSWPNNRPISYVVPYPPGGSTDILARRIANIISNSLHTSVVVENKSGGSGTVGGGVVARAKPDGYTILHTTIGPQSIVPHFQKLPYNPIEDLEPVILVGTFPHVLVVSAKSKIYSIEDLKEISVAKHGSLFFSSSGNGTILHMQAELLKLKSGIDAAHIPYKGDTPALMAVVSGEVNFAFIPIVAATAQIESGNLRAIAVTSNDRIKSIENVPTMMEQGINDFVVEQWQGVYVPAGTNKEIVQLLNEKIEQTIHTEEIRTLADNLKVDIIGGPPSNLQDRQNRDFLRWGQVVQDAGLK